MEPHVAVALESLAGVTEPALLGRALFARASIERAVAARGAGGVRAAALSSWRRLAFANRLHATQHGVMAALTSTTWCSFWRRGTAPTSDTSRLVRFRCSQDGHEDDSLSAGWRAQAQGGSKLPARSSQRAHAFKP